MIVCPVVEKKVIRSHYNLTTLLYRVFWGRHLHHGLWDGSVNAHEAAQKLTDALITEAQLKRGERVLDIGCGTGSSAIDMARGFDCNVTGITISGRQKRWANRAAWWNGLRDKTRFLAGDAETFEFQAGSFDLVWSIECVEHLFDKAAFFRRAAHWLRPGGRVAVCTVQAGDGPLSAESEELVYKVCKGLIWPSLGTKQDHRDWIAQAGLTVERDLDWSDRVAQTWDILLRRIERSRVHWLATVVARNKLFFLDQFKNIIEAYRRGAITYGCWVASKPA